MKNKKKWILYPIVFSLVVLICYGFLKIFAFNKPSKEKKEVEIKEELIEKLYSYIPDHDDYVVETFYTGNYTTVTNLSYSIIGKMIHNYIVSYDPFSLETVDSEEASTISLNDKILYKIGKEEFDRALKQVFGEINYKYNNFTIDANTKAMYINNYYYIIETMGTKNNEYVFYHDKLSYTVQDDGNTIKIYDYYLKCNKTTGICYNTENQSEQNSHITYREGMNLNDYKDYLKKYVHTFKYGQGAFHWVSSEGDKK